eukprot:g1988.t1
MDNANSFERLGPALAGAGYEVCALDLPGHGLSPHRPVGAGFGYDYHAYALATLEALQALGWKRCTIVGHSMGAGIATLVAGALAQSASTAGAPPPGAAPPDGSAPPPTRDREGRLQPPVAEQADELPDLNAVVLLEGLGPVSKPAATAPAALLRHLHSRAALDRRKAAAARRRYDDADAAAAARCRTVGRHPGQQSLSHEAALALVARATAPATGTQVAQSAAVQFVHDPAVQATVPSFPPEDVVDAFIDAIVAGAHPTLVVQAEHGWPFVRSYWESRLARIGARGAHTRVECEFEHVRAASHHLHLDPENAGKVATRVVDFLERHARDDNTGAAA